MSLPMRWKPAANMWSRGDTLTDIATMYAMSEKSLKTKLKILRLKYPRFFRPRIRYEAKTVPVQRLVYVATLKERALDAAHHRGRHIHAA